ncbi:DUF4352 domain-containing protein [Streptomyces sp. NPDC000983]|uniref:DUF4352 domain-containing protein n=1 Tax=Streptomyces sp. NPDC000983 TaxID=3154373 RepID=UPI003331D88D
MRRTTTLLACLLLAGAAGCSSDSDDKPAVSKASAEPATSSPSPSPSASPSPDVFKLRDIADITLDGLDFTATVLAFKDRGISGGPGLLNDGQKWALAEVKVCNKDDESFGVTPFKWSLAYADGARVEPTHVSGSGLPGPVYPLEATVKGGDCVRGNIFYQVPPEGRAESVMYAPEGLDEPVEWELASS